MVLVRVEDRTAPSYTLDSQANVLKQTECHDDPCFHVLASISGRRASLVNRYAIGRTDFSLFRAIGTCIAVKMKVATRARMDRIAQLGKVWNGPLSLAGRSERHIRKATPMTTVRNLGKTQGEA